MVDAFADGVWNSIGGGELVVVLGEFFFSGKDDWTYVWVGVLVL